MLRPTNLSRSLSSFASRYCSPTSLQTLSSPTFFQNNTRKSSFHSPQNHFHRTFSQTNLPPFSFFTQTQFASFPSSQICFSFYRSLRTKPTNEDPTIQKEIEKEKEIDQEIEDIKVFDTDKCWSCHAFKKKRKSLFCAECHFIQPPAGDDTHYFNLFGIEPSFELDLRNLSRKYQELQLQLHPDRYQTKSEKELLYSEKHSVIVSSAYHTLKEPSTRAGYLLSLCGCPVSEADSEMDSDFLMWVLELQEQIEDERDKSDEERDRRLRSLLGEISEESKVIMARLATLFQAPDPLKLSEEDKKEAKKLAKSLNFIHRMEQSALDMLPTI